MAPRAFPRLRNASRRAERGAQAAQGASKTPPRGSQETPKRPQEDPWGTPDAQRPLWARQEAAQTPQEASKTASEETPRGTQDAYGSSARPLPPPQTNNIPCESCSDGPSTPQDAPQRQCMH
eukprot:6850240-Pyramimonas_sp.AAC.1